MRRRIAALAAILIAALVVLAAVVVLPARPRSLAEQAAIARDLAAAVTVQAAVRDSSNGVIRASADFGIEEGIRAVPVRIVERMAIEVTMTAGLDMELAEAPRVCLVGPYWNPLDAGLSDRCWGAPDLGTLVAELVPAQGDGRVTLAPGQPVTLEQEIVRGTERCDYAPGAWRLQIDALPVIDGVVQPRVDLADLALELPLEPQGTVLPFHPNSEVRPCSYIAAVYTGQREPLFEE